MGFGWSWFSKPTNLMPPFLYPFCGFACFDRFLAQPFILSVFALFLLMLLVFFTSLFCSFVVLELDFFFLLCFMLDIFKRNVESHIG
ncbi:hypothetical protein Scep_029564 [Stephania cephalantha]|uniref:Transmembrane protein n=1 Tax=Stephania cephalantha TaxID=152367 RepID=A0AAP0E5N0_9MAGN